LWVAAPFRGEEWSLVRRRSAADTDGLLILLKPGNGDAAEDDTELDKAEELGGVSDREDDSSFGGLFFEVSAACTLLESFDPNVSARIGILLELTASELPRTVGTLDRVDGSL